MASSDHGLIGVTGATGAVGGRVARALAGRGLEQRLIVRDPARAPNLERASVARAEYRDGAAMRAALEGVRTLLLVSAAESADRIAEHESAVDAAAAAGVERVVYTSFLAAAPDAVFTLGRDHWATEERIRHSGMAYTFLRDSLYADFVPLMAGADGVIRGPAGDGAVALVGRDDVARVAERALLDPAHAGATYRLTGPEAVTLDQAAEVLSQVAGRPVTYVRETVEEAYASRSNYGAPAWEVEGWVTSYTAIAAGEVAAVSRDVEVVTGRPPESLETVLRTHPEVLLHLGSS